MCNQAEQRASGPLPGQHGAPYAAPAAPGSVRQALGALQASLAYLAAADPVQLTATEQAECLRGLQRAESIRIAAQSSVLAAFDASGGSAIDGHGTSRSWLRWQGRITGHAASAAMAWMRRLASHPVVRDTLATGRVSESWARQICDWTDLLPPSARDDGDRILLAAAAAGATLADLAGLAEEMRARVAPPDRDSDDPSDRSLRLDLHYRGAGRLRGDLTPRCAAALQAVLDALGKRHGRQDLRSQQQRDHDALEEACRRLIAAGTLPGRAGQATQIQLHINLTDLLRQSGAGTDPTGAPGPAGSSDSSGSMDPTGRVSPAGDAATSNGWAGREWSEIARRALYPNRDDLTRPQPSANLGPGPLARPGDLCDASIVPIVTGHVDHELLDRLAGLLAPPAGPAQPDTDTDTATATGTGCGTSTGQDLARRYRRELILQQAIRLLSGPGSLASRLRTGTLTGPAASISLPLDVGTATDTIPPHLRRAVTMRDQHCAFPGCQSTHCQVHHIISVAEGGPTRLDNLVLCCPFHHLIAIHEWGWQLMLNADGTKTAIAPDRNRAVHSHGPPQAA